MAFAGIVRKTLGPYYYSRRLNIPNLFANFKEYREHDNWSREQLLAYQHEQMKKMLVHAYRHTKYYRELFDECSFDPEKYKSSEQLNQLPILTKDIIRDRLDDLMADDIGENECYDSFTGGTSGVKMQFYQDLVCRSRRVAMQWRSDNWAGWDPDTTVAYVWPAIQDLMENPGWKHRLAVKYITRNPIFYAGFMDHERATRIKEELTSVNPTIIRCFPTPAVTLLEYVADNRIDLPNLKGVITTGEPLYPHQTEAIEQGFNAEVFNLYASREFGTTAAECAAHKDLHIAVDSVLLEITDRGRQLPLGQHGEILITDLHNYAMPFIRYQVGDYGQLAEGDCSCGLNYPLLKNVVGRASDNFIDADGNTIVAVSLVLHLVDNGPKVGQVQIVQKSVAEVLVRFTPDPIPDESVKRFYEEHLMRSVKGLQTVKFDIVDKIEPEKSGKYKFAICEIDPQEIRRLRA
ncbi:MAG: phenylacetate--CoA ligase family protein [candidate division Zixibacteria bacterium]|nr:phenylacetate--CoA ligase family protein [candidate division Zixibacteria bacterium]